MEQPPSPGTKPVELRDSMEELLRFTLQSHVNEVTLDFNLELPRDFCRRLLQEDPDSTRIPALYMHLASALCVRLNSKELSETCGKQGSPGDNHLDLKEYDKWFRVLEYDLESMLKKVNFELHVQEPYFTQMKDTMKTVEGRCAVGDYLRIRSGALILFNSCLMLEVKDVHHYASFAEMLGKEGLAKVLPGVKSIEEGVEVYRKFYTEEKERTNGVLAIHVTKPDVQPYASLARVLSGLGCKGIKSLLDDYTTGIPL